MNENLCQCHNCGGMFPNQGMADWTICRGCFSRQMEEMAGEPVYIDQLGIAWTRSELEAQRLAIEADVRLKHKP